MTVSTMLMKALGTFSYTTIKYVNKWQFLLTRKFIYKVLFLINKSDHLYCHKRKTEQLGSMVNITTVNAFYTDCREHSVWCRL